jgi:hypothetical protein
VLLSRLQDTLNELSSEGTRWTVSAGDSLPEQAAVQVALCCYPTSAQSAIRRWPDVPVLAVVPANDDGSAVQAALETGAVVCVRGSDPALVAAFIRSLARRRGLLAPENVR